MMLGMDIKASFCYFIIIMRTTMTLDDDLAKALKRKRLEENGRSFKEVVNEAIRNGLEFEDSTQKKRKRKFELKGRLLRSKMAFNFHKAQQLAEFAENDPDFR
jgi:Arc/MetJ family transcription regulator